MTSSANGQPAPGRRRTGWLVVAATSMLGFLLLLAMVLATGGTDVVDAAVEGGLHGLRDHVLSAAAPRITSLGSFPAVVAVTLVGAVVLYWRTRRFGPTVLLLVAVVVTAGAVYLVKLAVARSRPPVDNLLGQPALDYAFPSGHTTNGSVTWVVTALLIGSTLHRPWKRYALIAAGSSVGVLIGLSRVYLGYHWVSDVVAGWLLATAVIAVVGHAVMWLGPPASDDWAKQHRHAIDAEGARFARSTPPEPSVSANSPDR